MSNPLRVFSFGGGVQSTACLVLAAQGKLDYKTFLFSNVGEDSENPDTFEYMRKYAIPFAEKHGLEIRMIDRIKRNGEKETLIQHLMKPSRSIDIPAYLINPKTGKAAPGNRACTVTFKIKVIAREIKRMGATKENPAIIGIGISWDERGRATTTNRIKHQITEYPLLDLVLNKIDCINIITKAGLPQPPKSSCFYCPFHQLPQWFELHDNHPDLFKVAVDLEQVLIEKRKALGKDAVWLTQYGKPLDQVVSGSNNQMLIDWEEGPEDRHSCGPFVCSNKF